MPESLKEYTRAVGMAEINRLAGLGWTVNSSWRVEVYLGDSESSRLRRLKTLVGRLISPSNLSWTAFSEVEALMERDRTPVTRTIDISE